MFSAVASRLAPADQAAESDDDNISLTSTVSNSHDPDQEFNVQGILAISPSGSHYLVEWEGFPIYQCTWEPIDELGEELARMWEERKEEEACGKVEPFDVEAWEATVEAIRAAKDERHFRRNRKRKRLGLPETEPIVTKQNPLNQASLGEASTSIAIDSDSSESEAEVRDEPPAEQTEKPRQQAAANKNKGKAAVKSTSALPPLRTTHTTRVPATSPVETSGTNSRKPSTSKASAVSKPISPPPRRASTKVQATTGYQGTARRQNTKPAPVRNAVGPGLADPRSPVGPSEPAPKATAVGKNKASGKGPLTAKRTTTAPRTGNIFTSGKVRKTKPGFKEVLVDASQAPRMFSNHHIRRAAEKKALEERAPDPTNLQLFSLAKGLPARKTSTSSANVFSPISPSTQVAGSLDQLQLEPELQPAAPSLPVKQASVLESDQAPGQTVGPVHVPLPAKPALRPALKSRASTGGAATKKVAFADEKEDHGELFVSTAITGSPEPMDYEFTDNSERSVARVLRSPPPPETKPTSKKVILGRHAAINVLFTGLPAISDHRSIPWRDAFFGSGLETLCVRHICLAENFKTKVSTMVGNLNEASGSLEAKGGTGESVDAVARFLASGFLGLYFAHPKFNLIIYPGKCEEWKAAMAGHEGAADTDAVLRFWICDAAFDFTTIMRPWDQEAAPSPPQSKEYPNSHDQETVSLFQRWFSFDYQKLLPVRKTTSSGVDSFFLAFPSSKVAHVTALSNWLLACNPACRIFVGLQRGSWEAFTSTLREDRSVGVVIVHESLVWALRRFPKLHEFLQRMDDQYWCFSDPDRRQPLFPSMRLVEESRGPATPQFIRLFPDRSAILLTPSFLVSRPLDTRRLLEWFLTTRAKEVGTRLVTGCNLQEYLSDLAKQKDDERRKIKSSQYVNSDLELQARGLSYEECNARFASSVSAMELHNLRHTRSGPYEADEEDASPLIYAPPYIDPNDEQSLVNWFGWWSLQRADQLRQLWVLGTDEPKSGSGRFERRVRIPKYTRVTINDPDFVPETIQQHRSDVTAQEAEKAVVNAQSWHHAARTDTGPLNYLSPKSTVLNSDDGRELHGALLDIQATHKACTWVMLYNYPVSWDDVDMVHHFSDPMENYKRISSWWKFVFPFNFQGPGSFFNTYMGFFYTIDEEWNPQVIPKSPKPKRHPWIAVYRPVNVHIKRPYTRCEVIIWDPYATAKYPGRQNVDEKELSYMQRRVIQVVREGTAEKNPGTWLDQVWLGGFATFDGHDFPYPIDKTFNWLDVVLGDLRVFLPAPEQLMKQRGYIPVIPATAAPVATSLPNTVGAQDLGDASMELDSSGEEDDDEDARMIFHPPRGSKLPPGTRTRCTNKLYEAARLAKARNGNDTTMVYKLPSTTKWYREQVAEGREFQHITFETNFDNFLGFFHPRANPALSKSGPRVFD